jgi:hypothetical protein
MASWLDGLVEASFKAAPDGYVFQSPSPWLFARSHYYLVNDAQKAVIGEVIRKRARFGMVSGIVGVVGVLTLATVALVFFGQYFGPFSMWLLAKAFFSTWLLATAFFFLMMIVAQIYYMRLLRSIIKDLPTTDRRFTISKQSLTAMPKWALYTGIICGLFVVFALMIASYELMSEGRLADQIISQVLGITAGVFLAGFSVYGVVLKKKLGKTE